MAEQKIKEVARFCVVKDAGGDSALTKDGVLSAVASDATKDRDGEVIQPFAFEKHLDSFRMKDPVILSTHMHKSSNARPTIVGRAERIEVKDGVLDFDMTFAPTELAQEWKTLYETRYARSFSVGFIPIKGEIQKSGDGSVYHHTEVELLEISTVPVGSNRNALSRGMDEDIKAYIKKQIGSISEAQEQLFNEIKDLFGPLLVKQDNAYEQLISPEEAEVAEKLSELVNIFKKQQG